MTKCNSNKHIVWILFALLMIIVGMLFSCEPVFAGRLFLEKEYQKAWCSESHTKKLLMEFRAIEYVLSDKTRVDCVTDTHAIEFDFANKWAEAIGQALFYGAMTHKRAGIVIIVEDIEKDEKYYKRLKKAIIDNYLQIDVWVVRPTIFGDTL